MGRFSSISLDKSINEDDTSTKGVHYQKGAVKSKSRKGFIDYDTQMTDILEKYGVLQKNSLIQEKEIESPAAVDEERDSGESRSKEAVDREHAPSDALRQTSDTPLAIASKNVGFAATVASSKKRTNTDDDPVDLEHVPSAAPSQTSVTPFFPPSESVASAAAVASSKERTNKDDDPVDLERAPSAALSKTSDTPFFPSFKSVGFAATVASSKERTNKADDPVDLERGSSAVQSLTSDTPLAIASKSVGFAAAAASSKKRTKKVDDTKDDVEIVHKGEEEDSSSTEAFDEQREAQKMFDQSGFGAGIHMYARSVALLAQAEKGKALASPTASSVPPPSQLPIAVVPSFHSAVSHESVKDAIDRKAANNNFCKSVSNKTENSAVPKKSLGSSPITSSRAPGSPSESKDKSVGDKKTQREYFNDGRDCTTTRSDRKKSVLTKASKLRSLYKRAFHSETLHESGAIPVNYESAKDAIAVSHETVEVAIDRKTANNNDSKSFSSKTNNSTATLKIRKSATRSPAKHEDKSVVDRKSQREYINDAQACTTTRSKEEEFVSAVPIYKAVEDAIDCKTANNNSNYDSNKTKYSAVPLKTSRSAPCRPSKNNDKENHREHFNDRFEGEDSVYTEASELGSLYHNTFDSADSHESVEDANDRKTANNNNGKSVSNKTKIPAVPKRSSRSAARSSQANNSKNKSVVDNKKQQREYFNDAQDCTAAHSEEEESVYTEASEVGSLYKHGEMAMAILFRQAEAFVAKLNNNLCTSTAVEDEESAPTSTTSRKSRSRTTASNNKSWFSSLFNSSNEPTSTTTRKPPLLAEKSLRGEKCSCHCCRHRNGDDNSERSHRSSGESSSKA